MKTKIAGFSLLLLFTACAPAFMKLNGIRKPRPESVESVQKKLSSYNPEYTAYLCIPKDSMAFLGILKEVTGLPSNSIYISDGSRVRFTDTGYCAGKALDFARVLSRDSSYAIYPGSTFSGLLPFLMPVGKSVDLQTEGYDFTVVFFWASFLGRTNLNVFKVARELQQSDRGKLNFLYVNMDIQKSWNMKSVPCLTVEDRSKK